MASGGKRPNAGRKPGVPNALSKAAKDVIQEASERLGGVDGLVKWVQADAQNEKVWWGTIYPKLIPLTLAGDAKSPLALAVTFVKPD
jgi:hypothetical protein